MAANTGNIRAGITGAVRVAPLGSTAPATAVAPYPAAYVDLGYISEDGITESNDADTTEFTAWQNGSIVRRYISGSTTTYGFTCLETSYEVLRLFNPGSSIDTATGTTTITVKTPTSDPRAFGIDIIDGVLADGVTPRMLRIEIPKGELTERGDISYSNGDPVGYEMTVTCYPDANGVVLYKLTNDPAMAVPVPA